MKVDYIPPFCEKCYLCPDSPVIAASVTGSSWEESLVDTGSNWGGVDTDDTVYGL